MHKKGEIKSEKILIKDVFKMWFCIPEYQRPYVWGYEEISDLLDDLAFAQNEKPESEYFMGSFVYQYKPAAPDLGHEFPENDLLDGQQRLTTVILLLAVIRDLVRKAEIDIEYKNEIMEICQDFIYQKGSGIKKIPERNRLVYSIRENVQRFFDEHIKTPGGTDNELGLAEMKKHAADISLQNMSNGILIIRKFFANNVNVRPEEILPFLINNVLMIYVATEDLEDAFRLFMILNDRGIPLRNSDILKSLNLGSLNNEIEKVKYAKMWESAEGELGDDFDRFLSHIRTILVKEKARQSLLQEFEDKIYNPKEKDKATGQKKPVLLNKGKDTFLVIEKYLNHYQTIMSGQNYDQIGDFKFDNLVKVMLKGLPATDWVPPLMRYFEKFKHHRLMDFLNKLDNKFSADWIGQKTPTDRIEAMNDIIKRIDSESDPDTVIGSEMLCFDSESFLRVLEGPVYGKRFAKYILLKLDYYYQNHDLKMHFETLSVEHILPQNPNSESQWIKDFTPEQREEWTHKIGNLVLITRQKNTSQGNLDYEAKVNRYFQKNIDTCPNSLRVLKTYPKWTLKELQHNHETVIKILKLHYNVAEPQLKIESCSR